MKNIRDTKVRAIMTINVQNKITLNMGCACLLGQC